MLVALSFLVVGNMCFATPGYWTDIAIAAILNGLATIIYRPGVFEHVTKKTRTKGKTRDKEEEMGT